MMMDVVFGILFDDYWILGGIAGVLWFFGEKFEVSRHLGWGFRFWET